MRALVDAAPGATGYPATIGSARATARRPPAGSTAGSAARSPPTRSSRASAPRSWWRRCRGRCRCATRRATSCCTRRVVVPHLRDGRDRSPGCARCRCRSTTSGASTSPRVDPADAERALVLWLNDPSNPTGVTATPDEMAASVAWARERGIIVASDECYAEFTYDDDGAPAAPVTALDRRRRRRARGALAVEALEHGRAARRLRRRRPRPRHATSGEVRKHGGLMTPAPVQAAAAAALGDDEHVREQQARYARDGRVALAGARGARPGARRRAVDLLPVAAHRRRPERRLGDRRRPRRDRPARRAGRLLRCRRRRATPGSRSPLTDEQLALVCERLTRRQVSIMTDRGRPGRETITALWEGRDDLASVMPEADAQHAVHSAIELLDTGEARVAELVDDEVVVHEWLKYAVLLLFRLAAHGDDRARPVRVRTTRSRSSATTRRPGVRVVPGASARWGSYLAPGRDPDAELREHRRPRRRRHHGRHLGDRRVVRADRRARAPLRWRRHRRRARAAAGRAGDRSATTARSGQPLHGHAGGAGRRRLRARRGRDPQPRHPGDRRRDRRRGVARRRAALVRSSCRPAASAMFPGGEFTLPCALDRPPARPRASATTRRSSTTSCATTAIVHVTHRFRRRSSTPPTSSVSPPRWSRCRRRATTKPSSPTSSRSGCVRARRRSPIDRVGANVIARTQLGRDRRVRARRSPRHRARQRQRDPRGRRRRAARARFGRHEGWARGAAPPRRGAARRSRPCPPRRDARVLRVRGGRRPVQRAAAHLRRAARRCSTATSRCCWSPPTAGSRRVPGRDRVRGRFDGERAHAARPWMGRNAIHRATDVLARLAAHESDIVVVDGLEYRESLQVVRHRGRHRGQAQRGARLVHARGRPPVRAVLLGRRRRGAGAPAARGRRLVEVLQSQPGALPNLTNPLVDEFVDGLGLPVRPKLGLDRRGALRVARGSRRSTSVPAIPRSRTPRASS